MRRVVAAVREQEDNGSLVQLRARFVSFALTNLGCASWHALCEIVGRIHGWRGGWLPLGVAVAEILRAVAHGDQACGRRRGALTCRAFPSLPSLRAGNPTSNHWTLPHWESGVTFRSRAEFGRHFVLNRRRPH